MGKDKGGGEMWKREKRKGWKWEEERGNATCHHHHWLPVIIEGRVDKKLVLCPIHLMFVFVFKFSFVSFCFFFFCVLILPAARMHLFLDDV